MTFWSWIGSWVLLLVLGIIAFFMLFIGIVLVNTTRASNDLLGEIVGGLLILGGFLIGLYIVYRRAKGAGYITVSGGH